MQVAEHMCIRALHCIALHCIALHCIASAPSTEHGGRHALDMRGALPLPTLATTVPASCGWVVGCQRLTTHPPWVLLLSIQVQPVAHVGGLGLHVYPAEARGGRETSGGLRLPQRNRLPYAGDRRRHHHQPPRSLSHPALAPRTGDRSAAACQRRGCRSERRRGKSALTFWFSGSLLQIQL